jgi:GNAT superfamily N-acetyltransferase
MTRTHTAGDKALTFSLSAYPDLVDTAINGILAPDGVEIRPVRFATDILHCQEMETSLSGDRIHPAYGMAAEDEENTICLIAERDGNIVGQISCEAEISGTTEASAELWVSGVFVSAPERGQGIGFTLGSAAIMICEGWRQLAASKYGIGLEGGVDVSADTQPGSGGDVLIDRCQDFAMRLEDDVPDLCEAF